MTDTVTHIAGPVVSIQGRCIQRCVVCGEKLADNKNQAAPLNDDGTPPKFGHWPERGLVQVTQGYPQRWLTVAHDFMDDAVQLPDDFCMVLVE